MRDDEKMTVIHGKEEDHADFVAKNQDGYGNACVCAAAAVGAALDAGKMPEEAHAAMYDLGLTAFMAGCAARAVFRFHPRGDEFRRWWNRQYLNDAEAAEADANGGIVNPAILTLKD